MDYLAQLTLLISNRVGTKVLEHRAEVIHHIFTQLLSLMVNKMDDY